MKYCIFPIFLAIFNAINLCFPLSCYSYNVTKCWKRSSSCLRKYTHCNDNEVCFTYWSNFSSRPIILLMGCNLKCQYYKNVTSYCKTSKVNKNYTSYSLFYCCCNTHNCNEKFNYKSKLNWNDVDSRSKVFVKFKVNKYKKLYKNSSGQSSILLIEFLIILFFLCNFLIFKTSRRFLYKKYNLFVKNCQFLRQFFK